jgi:hypothetical protein
MGSTIIVHELNPTLCAGMKQLEPFLSKECNDFLDTYLEEDGWIEVHMLEDDIKEHPLLKEVIDFCKIHQIDVILN